MDGVVYEQDDQHVDASGGHGGDHQYGSDHQVSGPMSKGGHDTSGHYESNMSGGGQYGANAQSNQSSGAGKIFVGGVNWETSEDSLRAHFGKYGVLTDAALMKDKYSGQPRGFGFITYEDPSGTWIGC
jgi:hypothetical protein